MSPRRSWRREWTRNAPPARSGQRTDLLEFLRAAQETVEDRSPAEALRAGLSQFAADLAWPVGHLWVPDPEIPETLLSSGLFHLEDAEAFEPFRRATETMWLGRGKCLPGRVLAESRPLWLENVSDDPGFRRASAAREARLVTGLAFPVIADREVVAVLEFFTTEPGEPDAVLLDIAGRMGEHVGGIIERGWRSAGPRSRASASRRELLDDLPVLAWRAGSDGRRTWFNRSWLDFTGLSLREQRNGGWLARVHPDDRESVERITREGVRARRPFMLDYRLARRDGVTRWMSDVARPVLAPDGGFAGFVGSCFDITTRYSAVCELRASRERLHTLSRRLLEAQESERRRIARGLHDDIGQLLAGIRMSLHFAQEGGRRGGSVPREEGEASEPRELSEAIRMVEQCIESVRTLSLDLRPPHLDDLGLLPAVRWHLDRRSRESGVPIALEGGGVPDDLPVEVATAAFRVIQEAVTNAVRHAVPGRIFVSIHADRHRFEVEVRDDGDGFDRGSARPGGGLLGMEERVNLLGGALRVASTPGEGTRIVARFPLPAEVPP